MLALHVSFQNVFRLFLVVTFGTLKHLLAHLDILFTWGWNRSGYFSRAKDICMVAFTMLYKRFLFLFLVHLNSRDWGSRHGFSVWVITGLAWSGFVFSLWYVLV